jgi:hypothetical protein
MPNIGEVVNCFQFPLTWPLTNDAETVILISGIFIKLIQYCKAIDNISPQIRNGHFKLHTKKQWQYTFLVESHQTTFYTHVLKVTFNANENFFKNHQNQDIIPLINSLFKRLYQEINNYKCHSYLILIQNMYLQSVNHV